MGNFSSFVNQEVKRRRRVLLLYKQSELKSSYILRSHHHTKHDIIEQPLNFQ